MSRTVVVFLLISVAAGWAKSKDTNPADYPDRAHIISAVRHHARTSSYDPTSARWSYGASNSRTTEIQIGNLVYITDGVCKQAEVGSDYPARLQRKKIDLLAGGKVCHYRIEGAREK